MKKLSAAMVVLAIITPIFLLNVHIIRSDEGFDVILKDHMSFRETYADVRGWGLADYLSHSKRIGNYLIIEKHYPRMVEQARGKADSAKDTLRALEASFHQWASEKLR
ncbi:MAG: hypothetical protein DRI57_31040 [Deltaproteobacteria bacterium]|nr:MAG: hypothetical protein DRI57_31040 [Deltaproteobacteria bacterium]